MSEVPLYFRVLWTIDLWVIREIYSKLAERPYSGLRMDSCHARVPEGVAKSQFLLKGSGFQKWRPRVCAILKGFTPSTTLAWWSHSDHLSVTLSVRTPICPHSIVYRWVSGLFTYEIQETPVWSDVWIADIDPHTNLSHRTI